MSTMSVKELKELLHSRIERLQDPEDIQDLFVTVNDFLGERQLDQEENPEFLERLRHAVKSLRDTDTIPNAQVMQEAKQWITK